MVCRSIRWSCLYRTCSCGAITGAAISPLSVFLILQGLETYEWSVILKMLRKLPNISSESKMGQLRRLKRSSTTAQKYVKGKPSAILSFGVHVKAVHVSLTHYSYLLVLWWCEKSGLPSCNNHTPPAQELKAAGVSEDMVRLSIGMLMT